MRRAVAAPTGWVLSQRIVAWIGVLFVGSRYIIWHQTSIGFLAAWAMVALWAATVWRLTAARWLAGLSLAALVNGLLLLVMRAGERQVDPVMVINVCLQMVSLLACAAVIYWAFQQLGLRQTVIAYGLGMLTRATFKAVEIGDPAEVWKFWLAPAVTVLVLGLAMRQSGWVQRALALGLAVAAILSSGRSAFALLVLAVIVSWVWELPKAKRRSNSGASLLALAGVLAASVVLFQSLLLEGFLGESARQRSEQQLAASGSILLGGRPEIGATVSLMINSPLGFGPGVKPTLDDIAVASSGMRAIGYDPANGYVTNYMFGSTFTLHSVTGELWASFGLAGVAVSGYLCWLALDVLRRGRRKGMGDVLVVFLALNLIWDACFSPLYSALWMLTLLIPMAWHRMVSGDG